MKVEFQFKKELELLYSAKEEDVLLTIQKLRNSGDITIVFHLLKLYQHTQSETIKNHVYNFLKDISTPKVVPVLVQAIADPEFEDIKGMLVSVCWQLPHNFSDHITFFSDLVISSDYQTAIDAFTVVEESAMNISVDHARAESKRIKKVYPDVSEEKKPLVKELIVLFENYIS
ncbi:MAG: hypothetical protein HC896_04300 [Bacteroidales bacterium]|nr:hypothetical protein [Bacteroidales bacterium]